MASTLFTRCASGAGQPDDQDVSLLHRSKKFNLITKRLLPRRAARTSHMLVIVYRLSNNLRSSDQANGNAVIANYRLVIVMTHMACVALY